MPAPRRLRVPSFSSPCSSTSRTSRSACATRSAPFDVRRVLDRLLEKGKVIVKVAYADWNRFRSYTTSLHENGIELIEIPRRETTGKNSADIRLVVDAMDLSWSKEHIDTFVIVSGDSDFSPLVAKLKENGRHVIGLGMKKLDLAAARQRLRRVHLLRGSRTRRRAGRRPAPKPAARARKRRSACSLDTVRALQRENFEVIQASLVKDTMKRKRPAFSRGRARLRQLQRAARGRAGSGHRHAAQGRAQRDVRGDRRPGHRAAGRRERSAGCRRCAATRSEHRGRQAASAPAPSGVTPEMIASRDR